METKRARLLVVDDEERYTRLIKAALENHGYHVLPAADGEQALALAGREPLDLILLDVRLPGLDGYEVCRRLREFTLTPVIMLTARAEEEDKIRGLDAGADDYITKPFTAGELAARVRAVLRRSAWADAPAPEPSLEAGPLRLDFALRRVFVNEREARLTHTEYSLLRELARAPGRVFTPEELLDRVWDSDHHGETRVVRQAIHRLRQKIEPDPARPALVLSHPGLGYSLAAARSTGG